MIDLRRIVLFLIVLLFTELSAAVREVTGYGSGDTLEQAIFVAQGDAVLNAGAKTTVAIDTAAEEMIQDKGVSSNVLFLSEYKILESGDSFDGVYARIKARVCDVAERKFDNGKVVIGEGKGVSERAARAAAIGNGIMSLGARIQSVGIFEREELVRDENIFTGWAYVSEVEELEKKAVGGEHICKVRFKVFENKGVSGEATDVEKTTRGFGATPMAAMAAARIRAIYDFNAPYVTQMKYNTGVLDSSVVRRRWKGYCYNTKIMDEDSTSAGCRLDLSLRFNDADEKILDQDILNGEGFGFAGNREDAAELAKQDAVLNSGSHVELESTYRDGENPNEQMKLTGSGHVGMIDVEFREGMGGIIAKIQGPVARSEYGKTLNSNENPSGVAYCSAGRYEAYLLARQRAFVNGGAQYNVTRTYSGNELSDSHCNVVASRTDCSFVFDGKFPEDDIAKVTVKMLSNVGTTSGGNQMLGVGVASSEKVARELARTDAALNFRSDAEYRARYDSDKMVNSEFRVNGGAYMSDCSTVVTLLPDKTYLAVVEALSGNGKSDDADSAMRRGSFSGERFDNIDKAICDTRRKMLISAGSRVTADAKFENLKLIESGSVYKAEGRISECALDLSGSHAEGYKVSGTCKISSSLNNGSDGSFVVLGYGCGDSFESARKAAVENAVLNADAKFFVEEVYRSGEFVNGSARYNAEGYVFAAGLEDFRRDGDRYLATVSCYITADRSDRLSISKKEVSAKGWGVTHNDAVSDARKNAIDSVFGAQSKISCEENNGNFSAYEASSSSLEKGYVDEFEVKSSSQKMGLYEVTIDATVCQRGMEESNIPWGGILVIIIGLLCFGIHPIIGLIVLIIGICMCVF